MPCKDGFLGLTCSTRHTGSQRQIQRHLIPVKVMWTGIRTLIRTSSCHCMSADRLKLPTVYVQLSLTSSVPALSRRTLRQDLAVLFSIQHDNGTLGVDHRPSDRFVVRD